MSGIIIDQVFFGYQKDKYILSGLSLSIKAGTFLGISGSNGSGKSTLTYLLNGIIPHHINGIFRGDVFVDGVSTRTESIAYFSSKVGVVFQNPEFSLFNLTVREEIEFGLKNLGKSDITERTNKALEIVGLSHKKENNPQELSLGQKQRLALACVLALDTPYIVLDEPSSMLDYRSANEIYTALVELNLQGKTIITIEHDTDFLWQYTQESLILDDGKAVIYGLTTEVFSYQQRLRELGIKVPNTNSICREII